MTNFLRIAALDETDLEVISAHVQDAVVRLGDIEYSARENRVILPMNRFAWEKPQGLFRKRYERRRSVLHFDRVASVARNALDPQKADEMLDLLAVTFEPSQAPQGTITLHFAGGAGLRLQVECIEARLTDLGSAWETRRRPFHPV